ncbi:MAG: hypothetical protein ILP22_04995, partial [Oscillospiraceae bacterium]|nr:hypothetical protein [Oscillospiraceae bacterium]
MNYKTFGKILLAAVMFSAVAASGRLTDPAGRNSVLADSAYTYTAADVLKLKQCFMGKTELSPEEYDKYDFNRDGVINLRDMNLATRLLTQEITLPAVTTSEPVVTTTSEQAVIDLPEITMPVTTMRYQDAIPEIPYATVIVPEKPVT